VIPAGSSSERPASTPGPRTAAKATTRVWRRADTANLCRTVRARVTVLAPRAYESPYDRRPALSHGAGIRALLDERDCVLDLRSPSRRRAPLALRTRAQLPDQRVEGAGQMLGPVLEREAAARDGALVLAKVDVDANEPLAQQYGIRGIPARQGVPERARRERVRRRPAARGGRPVPRRAGRAFAGRQLLAELRETGEAPGIVAALQAGERERALELLLAETEDGDDERREADASARGRALCRARVRAPADAALPAALGRRLVLAVARPVVSVGAETA
jgi:hypothetical protein